MNMENIPDEVWQCNVCDELFQSYLELKKLQTSKKIVWNYFKISCQCRTLDC